MTTVMKSETGKDVWPHVHVASYNTLSVCHFLNKRLTMWGSYIYPVQDSQTSHTLHTGKAPSCYCEEQVLSNRVHTGPLKLETRRRGYVWYLRLPTVQNPNLLIPTTLPCLLLLGIHIFLLYSFLNRSAGFDVKGITGNGRVCVVK